MEKRVYEKERGNKRVFVCVCLRARERERERKNEIVCEKEFVRESYKINSEPKISFKLDCL